ncbi:hypothetical protein XaclCFBP3371_00290 [Xanthomonas euvesicatoria pv. citrumelonis]|nr:hypothetical protein XaclCFBP3371_00290 [Xanthomonas euvesicatoria pv. citrumelonis]
MDNATELARTHVPRAARWWAGKAPADGPPIGSSTSDRSTSCSHSRIEPAKPRVLTWFGRRGRQPSAPTLPA